MIRNIRFIDEGKGYIVERTTEPIDPRENSRLKRKDREDPERLKIYELEKELFDKVGPVPLRSKLYNCLIDRNIEFKPGINLIFGPNGCGKTTILKALGGWAGCTDGFTSGIDRWYNSEEADFIDKYRRDLMGGNTAIVEWDGAPVYYENFRQRKSYGSIGELEGSILNGVEELSWIMSENKLNGGAKSNFIFNQVIKRLREKNWTIEEISKSWKHRNSDRNIAFLNYLKTLPESMNPEAPITVLFDEMDTSEDILNSDYIFSEILPGMVEKLNVQIIIVTHNPFSISKKVLDNPVYNHIFLDPEYTKKCMDLLKTSFEYEP